MLKKLLGAFGARVHDNWLMVLSFQPFSQIHPPPQLKALLPHIRLYADPLQGQAPQLLLHGPQVA